MVGAFLGLLHNFKKSNILQPILKVAFKLDN